MILTGNQIQERLGEDIVIDPYNEDRVNPNSYNLSLHDELVTYTGDTLDMAQDNPHERLTIPEEGLLLDPNKLYLGRTIEYTETRNLVPMLEGRSSIGRLGLFVHVTAGFGDIGFKGYWTLEIFAVQPIRIYAGVEICQIFYHSIDPKEFDVHNDAYKGKYQGNAGIQTSRLFKDFEKKTVKSV